MGICLLSISEFHNKDFKRERGTESGWFDFFICRNWDPRRRVDKVGESLDLNWITSISTESLGHLNFIRTFCLLWIEKGRATEKVLSTLKEMFFFVPFFLSVKPPLRKWRPQRESHRAQTPRLLLPSRSLFRSLSPASLTIALLLLPSFSLPCVVFSDGYLRVYLNMQLKQSEERKQRREVEAIFRMMDTDSDGYLSVEVCVYDLCVSENVTNKSLAMGGEDWADSRTHIRTCTQTYRIYERVFVCVCMCRRHIAWATWSALLFLKDTPSM